MQRLSNKLLIIFKLIDIVNPNIRIMIGGIKMIAEILCVGTEILLGDIINTNAQYIAKQLSGLGISVYYQTTVGDNTDRIIAALDVAFERGSELVIMSGGLGPTKDDLTKEMLAKYFNKQLVFDQKAYDNVEERVLAFGLPEVTESLKKQAYVPEDSIILYNKNGTAPGCIMAHDGKAVVILPGPPKEMKSMFEDCKEIFLSNLSVKVLLSYNIKLKAHGEAPADEVGESPVADRLSHLLDNSNPTVATYAKDDGCLIRVTAIANEHDEALKLLEPVVEEIRNLLPNSIKTIQLDS
jgi:nicotinamide-nucleotide amidase